MPMRPILRKVLKILAALVAVLVLGVVGFGFSLRHPMPPSQPGPAAEDLARSLEKSVNPAAWQQTGAVRFTFGGRAHHVWLWDKARNFARMEGKDITVLVDAGRQTGRAYKGGVEVKGAEAQKLVAGGWSAFCNDTFWLNPLTKLFDAGTERARADVDGHPAVVVRYASGGVTPGDAYLWIAGDDNRPRAVRMYVHILPVKGMEASWEGWQTLATGALVATTHHFGPLTIQLTDVAGATTLAELVPGPDPFAPLLETY